MKAFFDFGNEFEDGSQTYLSGANSMMQPIDYDGDGIPDAIATPVDIDGDGIPDGVATYEDVNGDGMFDSIMATVDTNGDGITDFTSVYMDQNFDGVMDYSAAAMELDINGDGIVDGVILAEDADGDSVFETTQIMDAEEWAWYSGYQDPMLEPSEEGFSAGYEQFDPDSTNMDQVVGDPAGDAQCWDYQEENGPCAIYAQVMAYEAMTGQDIDPDEMIEVATEQGWYQDGTAITDMDKILNYLGAETEFGVNGDMEDLHECLEDGGRIVVAVDGNEIWEGNQDVYAPNNPNHAVTVIGIDYSGEEPMVILNDSGTMDGHAIMVPESQFMNAWEDSGYSYVEAYA